MLRLIVNTLRSHTRAALIAGLVIGVLVAVANFLFPPLYRSQSTFIVESGGQRLSGLAMLASEFGVAQSLESSRSPRFYVAALRSRALRDSLLATHFRVGPDDAAEPLYRILVPGSGDSPREHRRALETLERRTSIGLDPQTSIVSVQVSLPDRQLAADVANEYVRVLERFNVNQRRSKGKRRREFLEERTDSARMELGRVEGELRDFMTRNREYEQAPALRFEYQRLSREVISRQDVFTSIQKQYETARIEEVDDQPTITTLDVAAPQPERRAIRPLLWGVVAFFVATPAALALGFLTAWYGLDRLLRARLSGRAHPA